MSWFICPEAEVENALARAARAEQMGTLLPDWIGGPAAGPTLLYSSQKMAGPGRKNAV